MALPAPNYTQIPNIILDSIHQMKGAEAKVILLVCRQTLGFHRQSYRLSLETIQAKTGLSKQCVIDTCQALIDRDWIERHRDGEGNGNKATYAYSLKIESFDPSEPGVKKVDPKDGNVGSKKLTPEVKKVDPTQVKKVDPKDGNIQASNADDTSVLEVEQKSLKKNILNKDLLKKEIKESEPEQPFSLEPEKTSEPTEPKQPLPEDSSLPESVSQNSSVSTKDLGSDRQEAAARREIVTSTVYNSTANFEGRFKARTAQPDHAYPDLVARGLGHLWTGKDRDDDLAFDEWLIKACQSYLKKILREHSENDALNHITSLISSGNYPKLRLRAKEAVEMRKCFEANQSQSSLTPADIPSDEPVRPSDESKNQITPEIQKKIDDMRKTIASNNLEREKRNAQFMRDRYNGTLPKPQ